MAALTPGDTRPGDRHQVSLIVPPLQPTTPFRLSQALALNGEAAQATLPRAGSTHSDENQQYDSPGPAAVLSFFLFPQQEASETFPHMSHTYTIPVLRPLEVAVRLLFAII